MYLKNLKQIIQDYDLWLLDQFGVLHDGTRLYPKVIESLELLRDHQKKVLIITNSGKRSHLNAQRLNALGIDDSLYTDVVSSGEVFHQAVLGATAALGLDFLKPGARCLLFSHQQDESIIEGLPINRVQQANAADFVLLAGVDVPDVSFEYYQKTFAEISRHGLPLVCTNPDHKVLTKTGAYPGPGELAIYYQNLGNQVHFIGKPHPEIYHYCLSLSPSIAKSRVIAVGDSLAHDILGAEQQGLKTWWLLGGIERKRFLHLSQTERKTQSQELSHSKGNAPDFVSFGLGVF